MQATLLQRGVQATEEGAQGALTHLVHFGARHRAWRQDVPESALLLGSIARGNRQHSRIQARIIHCLQPEDIQWRDGESVLGRGQVPTAQGAQGDAVLSSDPPPMAATPVHSVLHKHPLAVRSLLLLLLLLLRWRDTLPLGNRRPKAARQPGSPCLAARVVAPVTLSLQDRLDIREDRGWPRDGDHTTHGRQGWEFHSVLIPNPHTNVHRRALDSLQRR